MQQKLTIDIDGEYDTNNKELIAQLGIRYFKPILHLNYQFLLQIKKEWMKYFELLEDYLLIDNYTKAENILLSYLLK